MNKQQYNSLPVMKQLEYVNSELNRGESLRSISKKLSMSKTTIRDRFKKIQYEFNAEQKQYIKVNCTDVLEVKHNNNINNTNNTTRFKNKHHKMLDIKLDDNIIKPEVKHNSNVDNNINKFEDKHGNMMLEVKHNNITTLFNKNDIGALQELINMKDELIQLLQKAKNESNIVDVHQITIDTDKLTGDIKTRSYNLYTDVIKLFTEFCNDNKQFTQRDLLSMAILEYINKYKK